LTHALEVEDQKMTSLRGLTMYLCYEFVLVDAGNTRLYIEEVAVHCGFSCMAALRCSIRDTALYECKTSLVHLK
jgi:hypothetical protein